MGNLETIKRHRLTFYALSLAIVAFSSLACHKSTDSLVSNIQQLRAKPSADSSRTMISLDHLVTEPDGTPIDCSKGTLEVEVEFSSSGTEGSYTSVARSNIRTQCLNNRTGHYAMVLDNSGSVASEVPLIRNAARQLAEPVLLQGGEVSLVRVSTEAKTLLPLEGTQEAVDDALAQLRSSRGWTALYDGIRMGNESLSPLIDENADVEGGFDEFCSMPRKFGIVVMTDGRENNSTGKKLQDERYPGDGVDTDFRTIFNLRLCGIRTPMYTVGVGDGVEHDILALLAEGTGGRYLRIPDFQAAASAFSTIESYTNAGRRICANLPNLGCGKVHIRVRHRWSHEGRRSVGTSEQVAVIPCSS